MVSAPRPARLLRDLREHGVGELFAGRFLVEREVALGGMGCVYRALDRDSGAVVALKILRSVDTAMVQRFATEVEALRRLSHPAIVRYVAHGGCPPDEPYLAMEWIEGESLSARLRRAPLAVDETIALGLRVAGALAAAHQVGIIHRDIKPANILLPSGAPERAQVADFGVARLRGSPHITATGVGLGTPGYAAPEQVKGADDLDGRADLFSLGCLLFRCLSGREAFEGAEPLTVIARLVLEEPPRVGTLRGDVPPHLDDLVARLLAKDRERRPASAAEVAAALSDAASRAPQRATDNTAATAPSRRSGRPASGAGRRHHAVAVAAGIVGLGLGLAWGGAWLGVLDGDAARSGPPRSAVSSVSPVSPAPGPGWMVDMPVSARCDPAAVVAHREGLRAMYESSWDRAGDVFARARNLDPRCPEVMLRFLQTMDRRAPITEQREQLRRTMALRDALGERDRLLLDAAAAIVGSEPPDLDRKARILREGARRFPVDAELAASAARAVAMAARTTGELAPALELARRAAALDRAYADAWGTLGGIHVALGRIDDGLAAYDRCLHASPGGGDCMRDRVNVLRRQGRCEEATASIWRWRAQEPGIGTYRTHRLLAASLAAQGASRDTLAEVLHMRSAQTPPDGAVAAEVMRLNDAAKLAAWSGDFDEALLLARALERRVADDPHVEPHMRAVRILVETLVETGRGDEAARLAQRFMRRRLAWIDSEFSGDRVESGAAYYGAILLGLIADRARISPAEWRVESAAWEKKAAVTMNPFETWVLRWGSAVGSRIGTGEALAAEPRWPAGEAPAPRPISAYVGLIDAYHGRLRLLAGDAARAEPLLRAAARSCQGLAQPLLNTRVHLWLGLASEQLGQTRRACDAYEEVLRRWARARPRSITADQARARRRALGCAAGRPAAR